MVVSHFPLLLFVVPSRNKTKMSRTLTQQAYTPLHNVYKERRLHNILSLISCLLGKYQEIIQNIPRKKKFLCLRFSIGAKRIEFKTARQTQSNLFGHSRVLVKEAERQNRSNPLSILRKPKATDFVIWLEKKILSCALDKCKAGLNAGQV